MRCSSQLPAVSGGHGGLLSWSNGAGDGRGAVSECFRVSLVCQPQTRGSPISKRCRRIKSVMQSPPPPPWDQADGRHRPVMSSLPALSGFLHSLSPECMWLWSLYRACVPSLLFWKARSLLDPAVVRDIGQITTNAGSQGPPGSVSRPGNDCIHG